MDLERLERLAQGGDTLALNDWIRALSHKGDASPLYARKGGLLAGDLETARLLRGLGFFCDGRVGGDDEDGQLHDFGIHGHWPSKRLPFVNRAGSVVQKPPETSVLIVFPAAGVSVLGSWNKTIARLCACDCLEATVNLWCLIDVEADRKALTTSAHAILSAPDIYAHYPENVEDWIQRVRSYARDPIRPREWHEKTIQAHRSQRALNKVIDGLLDDDNIPRLYNDKAHVGTLITHIVYGLLDYREYHPSIRLHSKTESNHTRRTYEVRANIEQVFSEIMLDYLTEVRT